MGLVVPGESLGHDRELLELRREALGGVLQNGDALLGGGELVVDSIVLGGLGGLDFLYNCDFLLVGQKGT